MFDAENPGREPDAIFHLAPHDQTLWALPWIAGVQTQDVEDGPADEVEVRLWFQGSPDIPKARDIAPLAPVPDRPFDLEAYNAGHAPPEGFWRIHPGLEAYEVEYDPDDGGNWWARLWLKPSVAGARA
ncbi:hypothetical protein J2800_001028 [Caulobacter rhizosphaerae]|uniref:Uncharacterized protein n=1 Tax=Caulobacter rhizosphaerae TaxID=2010972 RepID=A0ABU1MVS6_9CAUL|nr:hypothetical protein [Caulobacter rhizosphaerae]MDR6530292.1 hypothetical protein [Caulobacter rhizosphaerae]